MKYLLKTVFSVLAMTFVFINPLMAITSRGKDPRSSVGKQYVFLIAIDDYKNWKDLSHNIENAKKLKEVLKSKYQVDTCYELYNADATMQNIVKQFLDLRSRLRSDDSLFVYFSGHSFIDKDSNTGYWLAYDASESTAQKQNWLLNNNVKGYLDQLDAKHIFLCSNAYFAKSQVSVQNKVLSSLNNDFLGSDYRLVSRDIVGLSASVKESDNQAFAKSLIQTLDSSSSNYVSPGDIFISAKKSLSSSLYYGSLANTKHKDGASFVFFKNEKHMTVTETEEVTEEVKGFGSIDFQIKTKGSLYIDGNAAKENLPAGAKEKLENISQGPHKVEMRYFNGYQESQMVNIVKNKASKVVFSYEGIKKVSQSPDFASVSGGTFTIGSKDGDYDENNVHKVSVNKFYISRCEITQAEYSFIMKTNPSDIKDDSLPVTNVSWFDAVEYCNKRSIIEDLTPCYTIIGNSVTVDFEANGYRLPTEAEWEFAANGGSGGVYQYSGSENLENVAWFAENSRKQPHAVGEKKPNKIGIYDMSGNVREWCFDWYAYYEGKDEDSPTGASSGRCRVFKGGSFNSTKNYCRISNRDGFAPKLKYPDLGFRIVSNGK